MTRVGDTLLLTGTNLQVVNELNASNQVNGTGNIIVSRSEDFGDDATRTGSRYLTVGAHHTWTGVGAIVDDCCNTVAGTHTSVADGAGNAALGA